MRQATLDYVEVPNSSIRIMAGMLQELGLDPVYAAQSAGVSVDHLNSEQSWVSGKQELAFQRSFVTQTKGRRDVWCRTGERYRLLWNGIVGLASFTAPTLRHVVSCDCLADLTFCCAQYSFVDHGAHHSLVFDVSDTPDELKEFAVFHAFGGAKTTLRDLWTRSFPFSMVDLDISQPIQSVHLLFDGADVRYSSDHVALSWPARMTDRSLFHGDLELHSIYVRECEKLIGLGRSADNIIARVTEQIRQQLNLQLSLQAVATALGMSVRTLQRRLDECGVSFRDLSTKVKIQAAKDMLGAGKFTVTDIAWRLGYADIGSFSEAFRRATGVTPRQFGGASLNG